MTSGWGSGTPSGEGKPTGEFGGQVRGSGSGDRSPHQGSARPLFGMASLVLTLLSLVLWIFVSRVWDGLALLTLIFACVFFWAAGVFTRRFWGLDDE